MRNASFPRPLQRRLLKRCITISIQIIPIPTSRNPGNRYPSVLDLQPDLFPHQKTFIWFIRYLSLIIILFVILRFSNTEFTIKHYAGQVTYQTDGFLEKNKDYIVPEHISMLEQSEVKFIRDVIAFWHKMNKELQQQQQHIQKSTQQQQQKSSQQQGFVSVGSQFRVLYC